MTAVYVAAFALFVRAVVSPLTHSFVDADSEPVQGFVDIVFRTGHKPVGIGVLYAENHVAAVLAGKQVVIQSRAHASDVERAGGGGGESYPYFSFHLVLQSL